ncbi:MAG: hypothetical protein ACN6OB_14415 [Chryseobacterium jejuense]
MVVLHQDNVFILIPTQAREHWDARLSLFQTAVVDGFIHFQDIHANHVIQ